MSQSLTTIADIQIPDLLTRQLRIRQLRLETGQELDLEFHPAARDLAARLRARIKPTTQAHVRRWMTDLTAGAMLPGNGPSLEARIGATCIACADLPADVWSAETLKRAYQTFKFFPTSGEIFAFLKPDADKVLDVIVGLEAIAKAPVGVRAVPAREPYKLPPAPDWVGDRGLRRGSGDHSRPALNIPPPLRTVAEQVAMLNGGEAA